MKQSFDIKPPPELEGSADTAGNFKSAMGYYIRPAVEAIVADAAQSSKYSFLGSEYSVEETESGAGGGITFEVRNAHPLFGILEGGSKPHIITAVNGPYLIFPFMGHFIKVAQVNHPGTQGEHAFRDAWGRNFNGLVDAGKAAFYKWAVAYGSWGG